MAAAQDVVITGMGAVTCVGAGVQSLRSAAVAGRSGVTTITEFDTAAMPCRVAGVVRDFDPASVLDAKQLRLAARVVQLSMGAAMEATGTDAAGALGDVSRVGTILGTATGGLDVLSEQMEQLYQKGPRRVSPFSVPQLMDNASAAWVALRWGFRGPAYSMAACCATSLDAVGMACELIRNGRLDACLAGGAEGEIVPFTMALFGHAGVLTPDNEDPAMACRPFDRDRHGFVIGEGAGLLLLERRDRAEQRGAKILARVCGWGSSTEAQADLMSCRPDGRGLATAIQQALQQAGITPADVGYISANGSGSIIQDRSEAAAIHSVFGKAGEHVPVGATKSMVGYTMAASGALTTVAAALAVGEGLFCPTVTFRTPDPECRLNVLAREATQGSARYTLANAVAFGGHNSCLVLGAP